MTIDISKLQAFQGGDRGSVKHAHLLQQFQIDWTSYSSGDPHWNVIDSKTPILLQESIAVIGEVPHLSAHKKCKKTPIFTYLNDLKGYDNFSIVPILYDFTNITKLTHADPLKRTNAAYYLFSRKKFPDKNGSILNVANYETTYNLRYSISSYAGIVCDSCGPSMMDKINKLNSFKFGIACENLNASGYITEKLWDCFMADTVPIYFGAKLPIWIEPAVIYGNNNADFFSSIFAMSDSDYMDKLSEVRRIRDDLRLEHTYGFSSFSKKMSVLFPSIRTSKYYKPYHDISYPFGVPDKPKLSILIPSLHSRSCLLNKLLILLMKQISSSNLYQDIEVIVNSDERRSLIGTKRNNLLELARGEFICFIDDDDLVGDSYCIDIIEAIKSNPHVDCICFKGIVKREGEPDDLFIHSINFKEFKAHKDGFRKFPNHLTPIRSSLAKRSIFPEKNAGEDYAYGHFLMENNMLKSQVFIDKVLYFYLHTPQSTSYDDYIKWKENKQKQIPSPPRWRPQRPRPVPPTSAAAIRLRRRFPPNGRRPT